MPRREYILAEVADRFWVVSACVGFSFVSSIPARAWADTALFAEAEVLVTGGYNSNLLLTASPDAPLVFGRAGGVYLGTAPALATELRLGGAVLAASYYGDYRRSDSVGALWAHELGLHATSPAWGPLRLEALGFLSRFSAETFPANDVDGLGVGAGLSLELGARARAHLSYYAEFRRFPAALADAPAPADDLLHVVEGSVPTRLLTWCRLGPRAFWARVAPSSPGAEDGFSRWRLGLDAVLGYGRPRVTVSGWGGAVTVGAYHENQAGGALRVAYAFWPWLEARVGVEGSRPLSAGASSDYTGFAIFGGLSGSLQWLSRSAVPPSSKSESLRPSAADGRIRFRLRANGAKSVAVVGSWNGWSPEPLAPAGPAGLWEAALVLPPGEHRYRFVVDGTSRKPPDALRYVADGFGGVDGVLEIPFGAVKE